MIGDPALKRLKIVEVIPETELARTLVLEPLDGWQPYYRSGQFLTLVFKSPGGEKRRSFSMVSSFELNEKLAITVKKIDNGEFSRPLVYQSKPGDILLCAGISGIFTLPENPGRQKFCFLAAGSGITPCYALIKTLVALGSCQVTLFYSNRNRADALFIDELEKLRAEFPHRFRLQLLFSDHPDLRQKRLSKWLLEELIENYISPSADQTLFYLCGPHEYMQMAEIVLLTKTRRENIIKESFSSLPRLVLPEPPDKGLHRVKLSFNKQVYWLDVKFPESILKSALAHNIGLPYSCQAGRCAACVASCVSGKIWMAYNEVLADREVEKGRVLTCQAYPVAGDAEIVFDDPV